MVYTYVYVWYLLTLTAATRYDINVVVVPSFIVRVCGYSDSSRLFSSSYFTLAGAGGRDYNVLVIATLGVKVTRAG